MGDNKENIDALFNQGLQGFEADTPYDGWQAVKAKIIRSKQKRKALIIRWSMVSIALIFAFFAGYKIQNWNTEKTLNPNENTVLENSQELNPLPLKITGGEKENLTNVDEEQNSTPFRSDSKIAPNSSKGTSSMGSDEISSSNKKTSTPNKKGLDSGSNFNSGSGFIKEPVTGIAKTTKQELIHLEFLDIPIEQTKTKLGLHYNGIENAVTKPYFRPELAYKELPVYPSKFRRALYGIELGVYSGPTLPSRTVTFNDANEITENNVANEQLANTTTYGIQISKRHKNVEYGIGIFKSEWRQTSNNIILQGEPSTNSATSYTDRLRGTTSIGDFTFNISTGAPIQPTLESGQFLLLPNILQEYQFLDIPVSASYYLIDKRFGLKLQLGINNRILTNSMVQLEFPDGVKKDFNDLQPEAYSLQFISGLGFSYSLANRWNLNLVPTYFYGISPISIHEGATTRQHQFSILFGISYRL